MAGLIRHKDDKNVFVSYLFTVAKYDFSIYEKRILYRLLEIAQDEVSGMLIKDNLRKVHKRDHTRTVTMPIASILRNEKDENYTIAKKAFRTLACKGLEYEDDKIWVFINIIAAPKFDKKSGSATFDVYDEIWQCFLDFSAGFRKYELLTSMNFKSTYTMRMYELMSGQKTPLTFVNESFESLCDRFRLTKKMSTPQKFEEKVLNVAQAELDEHSPMSFTYKRETVPSRGRNGERVIGYTFYPRPIPKNQNQQLERKELAAKVGNVAGRFGMLKPEVVQILRHVGFDDTAMNKNKVLLVEVQRALGVDGMVDAVADIKKNAIKVAKKTQKDVGVGFYINGLKNILNRPSEPAAEPQQQNQVSNEPLRIDFDNLTKDIANKFKV